MCIGCKYAVVCFEYDFISITIELCLLYHKCSCKFYEALLLSGASEMWLDYRRAAGVLICQSACFAMIAVIVAMS